MAKFKAYVHYSTAIRYLGFSAQYARVDGVYKWIQAVVEVDNPETVSFDMVGIPGHPRSITIGQIEGHNDTWAVMCAGAVMGVWSKESDAREAFGALVNTYSTSNDWRRVDTLIQAKRKNNE